MLIRLASVRRLQRDPHLGPGSGRETEIVFVARAKPISLQGLTGENRMGTLRSGPTAGGVFLVRHLDRGFI